jgi:hypothetical protein
MASRGEKITKGWKVVGRDADGKLRQLSRRLYAQSTASDAMELAKRQGFTDVEIRTIQGYDKLSG